MMTRVTKASVALIVVVMLAGCGGTGASKLISTSSVVARAEAICARKAVHAGAVPPASSGGPGLTAVAAERARTARELAALKGPPTLTTGYRRLASLIAQEANLSRQLARYIGKGNDAGVLATVRTLRGSRVAKQALLVGLANCA
jgi:hypothetical protein